MDARPLFEGLGAGAWLNCAHQGPLPTVAADVATRSIADKMSPWRIDDATFSAVPARLRAALAELIGADPDDVVLGNSTTYGLDLLAHGLPWRPGDEVLLVEGDFPATVFPWLPLRARGVKVRLIRPDGGRLSAEQLAAELTPDTRVFCSSWVFSFTGHAVDVEGLGRVCRDADVTFVVNGSQAIGARPLDVADSAIDALVSCGSKWLCGPYATGFSWLRPELRRRLTWQPAYWLTHQLATNRMSEPDYTLADVGAPAHDVFCTANFFNFPAWTASIELLLQLGKDEIAAHDQGLVERFINGLDALPYQLLSPRNEPERSTLIFLSHLDPELNPAIHQALLEAEVHVALRDGNLRVSPHLYNTPADIDWLVETLNNVASRPR